MNGLEQTFYIFMAVMFVLMIASVVIVCMIRAKINELHRAIDEKLELINGLMQLGGKMAGIAKETAKKVMHKAA